MAKLRSGNGGGAAPIVGAGAEVGGATELWVSQGFGGDDDDISYRFCFVLFKYKREI